MTARQLAESFIAWWQSQNPKGRIYRNNTGVARYPGKDGRPRLVTYGIPAPILKRGKAKGGGGSDYISFRPVVITQAMVGRTIIEAGFHEVKTAGDKLSDSQKRFRRTIENMGGEVQIVKESEGGRWRIE